MSDEKKQDANDWKRAGGGFRADDAEPAEPMPPDPLGDVWRTVREWGAATGADWLTSDPPKRRYLLTRPDEKGKVRGAVPLGRVGMLAAAGGAGKSWALCQLALSVATGAKWLSTYTVPEPGRVLLALAEEEAEEMQRRLHYAAHELALTPTECDRARDRIVALPLAGRGVALTYSADELRGGVHALSIEALTPEQWIARGGQTLPTPPRMFTTATFRLTRKAAGQNPSLISVSYTHLTLPTNREV